MVHGKATKFQISPLRDCNIYQGLYDGILCRSASFDDLPICTDDEDIVNSPRRGKLCCCIRLKDNDEEIEEVEEIVKEDCRDIGCKNADPKLKTCPEGLLLNETSGSTSCCCNPDQVTDCIIYGCSNTLDSPKTSGEVKLSCSSGLNLTTINLTNIPVEESPASPEPEKSFTASKLTTCCCKDNEVNVRNFTCGRAAPSCKEVTIGTGSSCPSGSIPKNLSFDVGNDGTIESTRPCCCGSSSK